MNRARTVWLVTTQLAGHILDGAGVAANGGRASYLAEVATWAIASVFDAIRGRVQNREDEAMLDMIIRGGSVVDGTGAAPAVGDVGIRDGRIVAVGTVDEPAAEMVDADGLVVCPGFVDPHTHYDAQVFWDPHTTPSNLFGVTSMIGGNCGFTLAPLGDESDGEYLKKMMVKVEGMALEALELGVPWNWRSFGEYLDRVSENGSAINVGFLVGHCALRRLVMKDDSVGHEASAEQVQQMRELLKGHRSATNPTANI